MRPSAVASPPTAAERPWSRKTGDPAALVFRRRVKVLDRLARALISVSGISIICAVMGIGLFLLAEVMPLFQGARVGAPVQLEGLPAGASPRVVTVDEHQEKIAVIGSAPSVYVRPMAGGAPEILPIPELSGQRISAGFRTLAGPWTVLGTDAGQAWVGALMVGTVFEGSVRSAQVSVEAEAVLDILPGQRIEQIAFAGDDAQWLIAAVIGGRVTATRRTMTRPLIGPPQAEQVVLTLPMDSEDGHPTAIAVNEAAEQVLVGTSSGRLVRWRVESGEAQRIETLRAVERGGVSALAYLLGGRSLAVGGEDGSVATWSPVRSEAVEDHWHLTRIHPFPAHRAPVAVLSPSPRDKGFISWSRDGQARLHFMTSERTLAAWMADGQPIAAVMAPKTDGAVIADALGRIRQWPIRNPHPEITWKALFGKIWYEGYDAPDYIWQSTGGTDDFEQKFSLVPLLYGTLKGTAYALFFAIPLALFGALYCSQFLEKSLRNPIKSTIELMAALPSVVLGFVAGVVLAPMFAGHVVSAIALPVIIPLVAAAGMMGCSAVSAPAVRTAVRRYEFPLLVGWVLVGITVAVLAGPWLERLLFHGHFEGWLLKTSGMRYDQRNALVVGWVMGFAVVPIIFTICEDAFSAVPRPLVGASLACGASRWQTARRVVLPAAGSGVFSAIMVGFGRAVGETMIVLMATGNTPVMDWSPFNGFRTLSANIAVEVPEAPQGGTLYRVLFIAALLLFLITFVVNTGAEIIRLRLRRRLQGL